MGQTLDRTLADKAQCIARVSEIYRTAACSGSTHQTVLDELGKMRTRKEYTRLPTWAKQVVSQHGYTLFDSLYTQTLDGRKPCLMSVIIGVDGVVYPEGNDKWLERDTAYKMTMRTEHVWREKWNQTGVLKPWSCERLVIPAVEGVSA